MQPPQFFGSVAKLTSGSIAHGLSASHAAETAAVICGNTSAMSRLRATANASVASQPAGPVGIASARKTNSEASMTAAISGIRAAPVPRMWLQTAS